jgi:hypothetical protein
MCCPFGTGPARETSVSSTIFKERNVSAFGIEFDYEKKRLLFDNDDFTSHGSI